MTTTITVAYLYYWLTGNWVLACYWKKSWLLISIGYYLQVKTPNIKTPLLALPLPCTAILMDPWWCV